MVSTLIFGNDRSEEALVGAIAHASIDPVYPVDLHIAEAAGPNSVQA